MTDRSSDSDQESGDVGHEGGAYKNRIAEHTAHVREEAQALYSSINDVVGDVNGYVTEALRERPYAVLGAAAAVGYVLGGGLASRLSRWAIGMGGRMAMGFVMSQIVPQPGAGAGVGGGEDTIGSGGVGA